MARLVTFVVLIVFAVFCGADQSGYDYSPPQYEQNRLAYPQNQVEHTKSVYVFSAPEEPIVHKPIYQTRPPPVVRKHQQVIVIMAPQYREYENAVANLAHQVATETQTHIFVLSKEPDLEDLKRMFEEIRQKIRKPEVRFIKYRTPEEAIYAQKAIQAQYENSDGPTNAFSVSPTIVDPTRASQSAKKTNDGDLFTAGKPPFLPTGIDVVPGSSYLPPRRN